MTKEKVCLVKAYVHSDYDEGPDLVAINISTRLIQQIKDLQRTCKNLEKKHGFTTIEVFNYDSTFFMYQEELEEYIEKTDNEGILFVDKDEFNNKLGNIGTINTELKNIFNDDEFESKIDSISLCVDKDHFYWEGFIKHTSIMVSTPSMSLKELLEGDKNDN